MAEEKQAEKPKTTLIKHAKTAPKKAGAGEKPVEKKRVVVVKKKKVLVKKKEPTTPVSEIIEKQKVSETEPVASEAETQTTASVPKSDHKPVAPVKSEEHTADTKPDVPAVEAKKETRAPRKEHDSRESGSPQEDSEPKKNVDTDKPREKVHKATYSHKTGFNRESAIRNRSTTKTFETKKKPSGTRVGILHGKPVAGDTRPSRRPPVGDSDKTARFPRRDQPTPGGAPRGAGGTRFRAPQGQRPTGFRKPPAGGAPVPPEAEGNQKTVKKVFKQKKGKHARDYLKKKHINEEKDFQIKKKSVAKANPVPKKIDIMDVITVSELAKKMNLKASELIGKLMGMGMMVTINQQIDSDTAQIIAEEYGCSVNVISLYEETLITNVDAEDAHMQHRPPIVTVMGHVDHGKTKLLDAIRETNVVDGEFGGITQHIGAYKVAGEHGDIVFLDTPGHSAFTLMRARGAQVTDIVILVVAANDGVMPQTKEAIDHAKEAGVPIIVAINKVDLPEANPERVKQQLSEYDLLPEDWGGSTLYCEISALKRTGITDLLDMILLQSEMLELQANYDCRAEGRIIESKVDHGRGIVSTVIIQKGTLNIGDPFVAGVYPGKVRAMFNDNGNKVDTAGPSTPVEILGFTGIPNAGAPFQVTESDRQARQIGTKRQELERQGEASNVKKVTLDNLFDSIQDGEIQELKVIIKGDVHGSVEALQSALEKLSTSEIRLTVIRASAGAIIEDDINLATASNAIVIGFNVRPTPKAKLLADREKIDIRKYNIIYDAVDDMRDALEGMLSPEIREELIGKVEVRDIFKVPKVGLIAGSYVLEGKVTRNALVHIIRDSVEVYTGKVTSLKRFKDDAKEVAEGFECGISVDSYQDVRVGDILEIFKTVEIAKKL